MKRPILLLALAATLCATQNLFAWGRLGHATVARIAEEHLTKKARANLDKWLDGESIVYYASWLDDYKPQMLVDLGYDPAKGDRMHQLPHTFSVDAEGEVVPGNRWPGTDKYLANCLYYIEESADMLKNRIRELDDDGDDESEFKDELSQGLSLEAFADEDNEADTFDFDDLELGDDDLMLDDDFRSLNHTAPYGCFCETHARLVSRELGYDVTPLRLRDAACGLGPDAGEVKAAWMRVNFAAQLRAAKAVERAVHAVSPETQVGLMNSGEPAHSVQGRDMDALLRAFSGGGQCLSRPLGGAYSDALHTGAVEMLTGMSLSMAAVHSSTFWASEVENYPNTPYTKSAAVTQLQMQLHALFRRGIHADWRLCGLHGQRLEHDVVFKPAEADEALHAQPLAGLLDGVEVALGQIPDGLGVAAVLGVGHQEVGGQAVRERAHLAGRAAGRGLAGERERAAAGAGDLAGEQVDVVEVVVHPGAAVVLVHAHRPQRHDVLVRVG